MSKPTPLPSIQALEAYVPGLSIAEIKEKYKLNKVIKLASNENALGASNRVQEVIRRFAHLAFRYPQGGNPRLRKALAKLHNVDSERIAIGNGSDEIIDLLIRMLALPAKHNIVCLRPCFGIYPIQAAIVGIDVKRVPLNTDFSFPFPSLLDSIDSSTRLVFLTTPDNPSGYCPSASEVKEFAENLARRCPEALLVIDEAYIDYSDNVMEQSLLLQHYLPDNVAYLRTFSKSRGMAGIRLGYAVLPPSLADAFWRARLPFSVNLLAEEAALAVLEDFSFYEHSLDYTRKERNFLSEGLSKLGCKVWPSSANFLMFTLPEKELSAQQVLESLLCKGIIIRSLKSYDLPEHLRVSIGTHDENCAFLSALKEILA